MSHIKKNYFLQVKPTNLEGSKYWFIFDHYRLLVFNCAVIGRLVCSLLAQLTGTLTFTLSMSHCKIGDYESEQFLEPVYFTMCSLAYTFAENNSPKEFGLYLGCNHLIHKSVEKKKHVLTLQSNTLAWLDLSANFNNSMTSMLL